MLEKTYEIEKTYMGKITYESDLLTEINKFCENQNIRSGQVSIIGAVKEAKLGYYCQTAKTYQVLEGDNLKGGLEIVSCIGNVSIKDSKPFAHLHLIVSDKKGKTFGGHLMPGTIVFAGEFIIQKFKGEDLIREKDELTGLPLWGNI